MKQNIVEAQWRTVKEYHDITYQKSGKTARIAFNRPNVRNAFRPRTVGELFEAFLDAREDTEIGVVLLSGEGPSSKDGKWAFCSGGPSHLANLQMTPSSHFHAGIMGPRSMGSESIGCHQPHFQN